MQPRIKGRILTYPGMIPDHAQAVGVGVGVGDSLLDLPCAFDQEWAGGSCPFIRSTPKLEMESSLGDARYHACYPNKKPTFVFLFLRNTHTVFGRKSCTQEGHHPTSHSANIFLVHTPPPKQQANQQANGARRDWWTTGGNRSQTQLAPWFTVSRKRRTNVDVEEMEHFLLLATSSPPATANLSLSYFNGDIRHYKSTC